MAASSRDDAVERRAGYGQDAEPRYPRGVVERRTQAERRAESRERLINAAVQLLAERGYANTSLVEIGRAAGLSRGLVSHHFGSKEACMQAVVGHLRVAMDDRIASLGGHGADAVDAILDVYFDGVRRGDHGIRAMYVILIEGLTATPGLRAAVAETNAITRRFIAERVAEMLDHPVPEPEDVPQVWATATLIEGILRGVALQWFADPDNLHLDTIKVTAKAMVRSAVASFELSR